MTPWFAFGVPVVALAVGVIGYLVIQLQSRAFDRRHPQPATVVAEQRAQGANTRSP